MVDDYIELFCDNKGERPTIHKRPVIKIMWQNIR